MAGARRALRAIGTETYADFLAVVGRRPPVTPAQFEVLLAVSDGYVHRSEISGATGIELRIVLLLLKALSDEKLIAPDERTSAEFDNERPMCLRQPGARTIVETARIYHDMADRRISTGRDGTDLSFDEVMREHFILAAQSYVSFQVLLPEVDQALARQKRRISFDRAVVEDMREQLLTSVTQAALASRAMGHYAQGRVAERDAVADDDDDSSQPPSTSVH